MNAKTKLPSKYKSKERNPVRGYALIRITDLLLRAFDFFDQLSRGYTVIQNNSRYKQEKNTNRLNHDNSSG